MLKKEWMPQSTRKVFEALSHEAFMSHFVLIGGTALSLQIGHRLSEDLDFWLPGGDLNKANLDAVLANLIAEGYRQESVTPAWKIHQAKINGIDLLSQVRDHVIDGVKVTFFARHDIPYQHFSKMPRIHDEDVYFEVLSKDAIFHMKSWLISRRVRSRDLFDLMVYVRDEGYSIQDILDAGSAADPSYQREYAKDVLVGNIPLDNEDEGFSSIGIDIRIERIYTFFLERVNDYEVQIAKAIVDELQT